MVLFFWLAEHIVVLALAPDCFGLVEGQYCSLFELHVFKDFFAVVRPPHIAFPLTYRIKNTLRLLRCLHLHFLDLSHYLWDFFYFSRCLRHDWLGDDRLSDHRIRFR